tara:strand:+ start:582 stop:899 length:318 start_codon:yes stop_codon:yes gene_type:complete
MKHFFHDLPSFSKLYLASQGVFLALNITTVKCASFRYLIWDISSIVQWYFLPGTAAQKLLAIFSSLLRDCHFRVFEFAGTVLNPLISRIGGSLIGLFYKLDKTSW